MASKRQIRSNRTNSKKSTGPRTPGGKFNTSWNRWRHGLSGRRLCILDSERPEFEKLQKSVHARFQPVGRDENDLFAELVRALWNLHRVCRYLAQLNKGKCPEWAPTPRTARDRLARYRTLNRDAASRAIDALRDLRISRAASDRPTA